MGKINQVIEKKLGREDHWGEADIENGIIYIDPRALGRKDLEIRIHEGTHVLQPYLCEDAAKDYAAEMTRMLWESGYRRTRLHGNDESIPMQDENISKRKKKSKS